MDWLYDHPYMTIFLFVAFIYIINLVIYLVAESCSKQYQMEQAKTADFVMYTNNGEALGMEHEVIVDMDTGYQYLVFNINGDYVIAPRVSEDGTFYKTVE